MKLTSQGDNRSRRGRKAGLQDIVWERKDSLEDKQTNLQNIEHKRVVSCVKAGLEADILDGTVVYIEYSHPQHGNYHDQSYTTEGNITNEKVCLESPPKKIHQEKRGYFIANKFILEAIKFPFFVIRSKKCT